jgi:hypothetical protein
MMISLGGAMETGHTRFGRVLPPAIKQYSKQIFQTVAMSAAVLFTLI